MNYKFLAKNGLTMAFVLGLVGIVATLLPVFAGLEPYNALADLNPDDITKVSMSEESGIFYMGIYVSYILGIIAFGLAVIFSIVGVFTNLKESKFSLIAVAVIAVLFIALNATASTDLTPAMEKILNEPDYSVNGDLGIYKMVSAGINGSLILMAVAFASMILMEIWNFFKNS